MDISVPHLDTGCLHDNLPGDIQHTEGVLWLGAPSPDEAIMIAIMIGSPTIGEAMLEVDGTPLGAFYLTSDEVVMVMAALRTLTDDQWTLLHQAHDSILKTPDDFGAERAQRGGILMADNQTGLRTLLEIAPYPEPPS